MRQRRVADVGHGGVRIDLELQHPARDVDRARDVAGFEFRRLAHVDQDFVAAVLGESARRDLANLLAGFGDQAGGGDVGIHLEDPCKI